MKKDLRYYTDEIGRTQVTLAFSEKPEDELCDFCSMLNPPYKVYPCKDFEIPGMETNSLGEWNACLKCAELIDADDREGLADRSSMMLAFNIGEDPTGEIRKDMRVLHDLFFANRIMPQSESSHPEPKSGQPESP